jgi:hypothetical protein
MNEATLPQGIQVLDLVRKKGDHIQRLLEMGLLSDLLEALPDNIDRDKFQEVIGLKPRLIGTVTLNIPYGSHISALLPKRTRERFGEFDFAQFPRLSPFRHTIPTVTTIYLLRFDVFRSSAKARTSLRKSGFEAGGLWELLASNDYLCEQSANIKPFAVTALGSVSLPVKDGTGSFKCVASLEWANDWDDDGTPNYEACGDACGWPAGTVFLCVKMKE